jgi:hypothetical protein
MHFVLFASLAFALVGGALGLTLAVLTRRAGTSDSAPLVRALLFTALVPFALHMRGSYGWATGWLDLEQGPLPLGRYPGALAFFGISVPLLLAVAVAGWHLARLQPRAVAFLPGALFVLYFELVLPTIYWRAPGSGPVLDNIPLIWLMVSAVGSTTALFTAAVAGRTRFAPLPLHPGQT